MTGKVKDVSVYENYLYDLGILIREMAVESKLAATQKQTDFATGYMDGFHRIVSLMQQQAKAFDIPLENIGLDGIDPDVDLV
ncbi:MAG: hypothetical protein LUQ11_12910 [Methylococcaceae bacterium]|nr:hypothetical protein [Methylococcaceae bacterium]